MEILARYYRLDAQPPPQSLAHLPSNLRRLREAKGYGGMSGIARLAIDSGVSGSTIRDIEGERGGGICVLPNPTLGTALKLALALGVGIEALVEVRE